MKLITFTIPAADIVPDDAGNVTIVVNDDVVAGLAQLVAHGITELAKTDGTWFLIRSSAQALLSLSVLPKITQAQQQGALSTVRAPDLRSKEAIADGFAYGMGILTEVLTQLIADQHVQGLWQKEGTDIALVGGLPTVAIAATTPGELAAPGNVTTRGATATRSDTGDVTGPLVSSGDERVGQDAVLQGTDTATGADMAERTPLHSG
jgi:hypothetical protein